MVVLLDRHGLTSIDAVVTEDPGQTADTGEGLEVVHTVLEAVHTILVLGKACQDHRPADQVHTQSFKNVRFA